MKVLVNKCYGGFSFSKELYEQLGLEWDKYGYLHGEQFGRGDEIRTNPEVIAAVEAIGVERASGECASLCIVEIPDGIDWYIDEYDGWETVRETHRSW